MSIKCLGFSLGLGIFFSQLMPSIQIPPAFQTAAAGSVITLAPTTVGPLATTLAGSLTSTPLATTTLAGSLTSTALATTTLAGTFAATTTSFATTTTSPQSQPSTLRVYLRMKINSTEDLTDPTVMENFLLKIKPTSEQFSKVQLKWTLQPKREN
ncbi:mucin-19-like [Hemibagrus wyckioides]|uniref:mucin-19-like n=1 Tax=Hemibagrus wyckioides TaxID=337641 RepID=UPI00266C396F|nr:mucin-19-like [Hemibagrus wyckioides]